MVIYYSIVIGEILQDLQVYLSSFYLQELSQMELVRSCSLNIISQKVKLLLPISTVKLLKFPILMVLLSSLLPELMMTI